VKIPEVLFVPPGTQAPELIDAHEVWVDVGSRAEPPVFDHHSGETESTATLVQAHSHWLKGQAIERVFTHSAPDLDALTAIWLIRDAKSQDVALDNSTIERIVGLVNRHDRGDEPSISPTRDWGVLFTEFLADLNDEERVVAGIDALDRTYNQLAKGVPEKQLAEFVFPATLILQADDSEKHFHDDWISARRFRMSLSNGPNDLRAVHVTNPVCTLFPRLLRWQNRQGILRADICIVSTALDVEHFEVPLWRHIISVPRDKGLSLIGLGDSLEQAERGKEDQLGGPLVPERKRLTPGKGRFGSGVASPWYDGRGHGYTIIDTPCFSWQGRTVCGSVLTPEAVTEVLTTSNWRLTNQQ
jgi:hypothetical protein